MTQPAKILLVDDDPVFVEATKTVLESKYRVITAQDGEQGLEKARKEKPDLILLDIIMPAKDGFHVCKQLKQDPELAHIRVIMLTSFAQHKGETNIPVDAGLELEAEGYIEKPVSPEALLKQVKSMLKK
jgi:two-component system alkaline phosphatase synthesis response regulator PhoP